MENVGILKIPHQQELNSRLPLADYEQNRSSKTFLEIIEEEKKQLQIELQAKEIRLQNIEQELKFYTERKQKKMEEGNRSNVQKHIIKKLKNLNALSQKKIKILQFKLQKEEIKSGLTEGLFQVLKMEFQCPISLKEYNMMNVSTPMVTFDACSHSMNSDSFQSLVEKVLKARDKVQYAFYKEQLDITDWDATLLSCPSCRAPISVATENLHGTFFSGLQQAFMKVDSIIKEQEMTELKSQIKPRFAKMDWITACGRYLQDKYIGLVSADHVKYWELLIPTIEMKEQVMSNLLDWAEDIYQEKLAWRQVSPIEWRWQLLEIIQQENPQDIYQQYKIFIPAQQELQVHTQSELLKLFKKYFSEQMILQMIEKHEIEELANGESHL